MNRVSFKSKNNLFKYSATVATVAVPAVLTTKIHVDMFNKSQKVKRQEMQNKMIGFWSGFALGAVAIHRSLAKTNFTKFVSVLFAATSSFLGLKAGKLYNKNFVEKQKD